ncbi:choice-of-anchor B family protein [Sphingobacteriales bacterium UPWRP_1]|nr:hypothetical protein B6N25_03960 [Sphingobacteriales bacterium TSM_CSS]PSJ76679.1 choice-of-anchor B family protein [Sphingobacteriales bacterium UPWRP_1]
MVWPARRCITKIACCPNLVFNALITSYMKNNIFLSLLLLAFAPCLTATAQPLYPVANLLFNWKDTTLAPSAYYNNTYNEVWGFVQNGREYAVIGSTAGTHIFDVTDPVNAYQADFVPGAFTGPYVVHRDYDSYNGFLYMVCDEGNSTLQIADLRYLPDSVHVVYDSDALFMRSHNVFVDTATAKLYACITKHTNETLHGLEVFDLQDPTNPQFLADYNLRAHDVYVQNDTVYLSGEGNGFFIVDFTNVNSPQIIGSLTDYAAYGQGYNHSGWITQDGNFFVFADENHGLPMKMVRIDNLSDIQVVSTISSDIDPNSIPHNQIIRGNYLYVSYYHDGLQVFDVSDPYNPFKVCQYKTYLPTDHDSYRGAWGVYPYLPSGHILVSDMQYGLFVLDVGLLPEYPAGIANEGQNPVQWSVFPSVFTGNQLNITTRNAALLPFTTQVYNSAGQLLVNQSFSQPATHGVQQLVLPPTLPAGCFIVKIASANGVFTTKVIKM